MLFSLKKKEILPLATTWMNQKDMMLSEISQTQKDKQMLFAFTFMWNLKNFNS